MVAVGRMILLLVVVRGAVVLVVSGAVVLVVMGAVVQVRPNYCCHKITQSVPNLSSLLLYGA